MPKFAANLTLLFTEMDFLERFAAASAAGFKGVEILFPYEYSAVDVLGRLRRYKLDLVSMNAPPPNYTGRPRGFAAVPGGELNFRRDFQRALRVANAMGALRIQLMAGVADGAEARATMVENLRWACAEVASLPVQLTIEPKSRRDVAGYFLNDVGLAAGIIDEVGSDSLGLQFDTYHIAAIAGSVEEAWKNYGHLVTHVQVASHPERAEPEGGIFDAEAFFDRLDADGYQGWVSAEYNPKARTELGLGWLHRADPSLPSSRVSV